ncbi:glycosyltransferase [Paenibacillus chibensis]|uniref:glycosyltransferase n=1 Tax=Paenibacillus chibensis TaxID=59846 RepID=UPI000FDBB868|nr:glycosyltransferase [Paenibacillus chibensis]MEC0369208.1 glycosyltransferase [Paenibacillus chibensis]
MKVLLINKYFYIKGGSETYFFGLKQMLEEHNHTVIEFSMKDERNEDSSYEGYFVSHIDYEQNGSLLAKMKNGLKLIHSKEAFSKLCRLIEDTRPDVAHVNLIYHQLTPSVLLALKKYGIPVVLTSHDYKLICPNYKLFNNDQICTKCIGGKYYNCFLGKCHKDSRSYSLLLTMEAYFHKFRKTYQIADVIICPSDFMYNMLLESGFSKSKLTHIPNFVAQDFTSHDINLCAEGKGDYFLYYGRLSKEKGLDLLLDSMKLLKDGNRLIIVGTGPEEGHLQERVRDERIANVRFTGFKSGEELNRLIREAKATIIPSVWHEVFGLTIVESYQLGTPVIGSRVGGISELIEDQKSGYLFNGGDAGELAQAMQELNRLNSEAYRLIRGHCLSKAQEYGAQAYYQAIIVIYERLQLINQNRTAGVGPEILSGS